MLFIFLPPSPHKFTRAGVDNRSDVVCNVLLLPAFVLKGDCVRREWLECISDVDLRSTCDTDTKIRKSKADQVFYKIKNLVTCGWGIRCIRTFVKGIHDEVNLALMLEGEHLLEASGQSTVIGLTPAVVVRLVEYFTQRIGTGTKLDQKRGK